MAQTLRLSMFQSWTKRAGKQIQSASKSIDTAFEVTSSYIYMTCRQGILSQIVPLHYKATCDKGAHRNADSSQAAKTH